MTSQLLSRQSTASSETTPSSSAVARAAKRVLATTDDSTGPILRAALAVVMWPHGAQKVLGWFGGYGWDGTMGFLTGSIGLPSPIAALTIALEFFGPLFLLLGLGVRAVAAGFVAIMIGAIATVHAPHGFFMNWSGAQAGEGFEYHLLVIAMALVLLVRGAGSFSFDRKLAARVS